MGWIGRQLEFQLPRRSAVSWATGFLFKSANILCMEVSLGAQYLLAVLGVAERSSPKPVSCRYSGKATASTPGLHTYDPKLGNGDVQSSMRAV